MSCSLDEHSKSWGLYEFLSDTLGGGSDEPDTGPKFGKNMRVKGADDRGNFKGDRRVFGQKCHTESTNSLPHERHTPSLCPYLSQTRGGVNFRPRISRLVSVAAAPIRRRSTTVPSGTR